MKNRFDPWHPDYDFVDDVEPIQLSYPHAVFTGSFKDGISSFSLNFREVSSYLGHMCLCGAGGYRIAQLAIKHLTADGSLPEKDRFTLVSSNDHTISDVVSFILGCARRNDPAKNQYFIDETIENKRREYLYKIYYHPSEKAVQVLYRKHLLVGNEYMDILWEIEKALDKNPESVSGKEKITYRTAMIKMVRNVLFDEVPGLFEVNEIAYTDQPLNLSDISGSSKR